MQLIANVFETIRNRFQICLNKNWKKQKVLFKQIKLDAILIAIDFTFFK